MHRALTVASIKTDASSFIQCTVGDDLLVLRRRHPDIDGIVVYEMGAKRSDPAGVAWLSGNGQIHKDRAAVQVPVSQITVAESCSILDAARALQRSPLLFIRKKRAIAGLVTRSDLERIPARMAMLALILELEGLLADIIKASDAPAEGWAKIAAEVNESARDRVQERLLKGSQNDRLGPGQAELALGFREKSEVVGGLLKNPGIFKDLQEAVPFRNALAHDLPFEGARTAPLEVMRIDRLMEDLRTHVG